MAFVRIDVSEDRIASIIRVTRIGDLWVNRVYCIFMSTVL
jgi:hypothetical protein